MARISRHELKQDEFVDSVDRALDYLERHGRSLLLVALALVLGGGSAGGYYWYSKKQEAEASAALGQAMITLEAPVQAGLPALPGESETRVFTSEEEKYRAAKEEFAALEENYPRTRSAQLARHYQAVCQWKLGERKEAVATLEELSRSAEQNIAAVAKFHLAGFYETLGRLEDAKKLYRELADHPAPTVPRANALLALADLEGGENPEEARRLLEQVKQEYSDTRIASEVTRRLQLLPPAPVASQETSEQP